MCELLDDKLLGKDTPTASVSITEDDENNYVSVDVRLSRGNDNGKWQSDEEITITDTTDEEFTDTNVLRVADLTESLGTYPNSPYNGLYLSNVWNCGEYTENGEGTPGNKYQTDESSTAKNLFSQKYRNGVRYQD